MVYGYEVKKEYRFDKKRRWRVDYAVLVNNKFTIAIEIEGGVWLYGRHNRAAGFLRDMEKYNALAKQGVVLLRYTPDTPWLAIEADIKETLQNLQKNKNEEA